MIKFNVSREESEVITDIAERAMRMFRKAAGGRMPSFTMMDLKMDITATHCNGNPLRLRELAEADDFNFSHDLGGIVRHINRETGQLGDCFVPRYSA